MVDVPVPMEMFSAACRTPFDGSRLPAQDNNRHSLWKSSMQYNLQDDT